MSPYGVTRLKWVKIMPVHVTESKSQWAISPGRHCYGYYLGTLSCYQIHDDVMKWKHFPRYWLFVRGIHRSPVNSPHKGQWRGALMFCLVCVWINGWINNREAGDLRRYRANYDVTVMNWTFLIDRAAVDEICGCPILKWIVLISIKSNSSSNGYLSDMPIDTNTRARKK